MTKINYNGFEQFRGAIVHLSLDCSVKYDEICDVYFISINLEVSFARSQELCALTTRLSNRFFAQPGALKVLFESA